MVPAMANGYPAPQWTQTPNALFDVDMLTMSEAELKCTLAIIRQIIGWHKAEPQAISYTDLEALTGLSRDAVRRGVAAAIERGRIKLADERGPRGCHLYTIAIHEPEPTVLNKSIVPGINLSTVAREDHADLKKVKEKDSTVAKNATVRDATTAKPKRKVNPLFDAVALHIFEIRGGGKIPGGRVGRLVKFLKGYTPAAGGDVTPQDVADFATHWRKQHSISIPRDLDKFSEHFAAWHEQRATTPLPPDPLSPEDINAGIAALTFGGDT